MKKLTLSIIVIIIAIISTYAQNSFKYQAVFRDTNDKPYTNTNIDLRFTILSGSETGTVTYSEKQTVVSSSMGIVAINIGEGNVLSGNFGNIDWAAGKYYLKVDADINGTGTYEFFGTNIISRVPIAVYADNCGNTDDADADPNNEIQTLTFDANTNQLSISKGNSVAIPTGGTDADADPQNEIQTLSKTGNTITLSKNGGSFRDEVDDNDADSTNEIQQLHYDYIKNLLWIDGGQDSIFNYAGAAWDLFVIYNWSSDINDTLIYSNYPVSIPHLWSDTINIKHIGSIGGDIFLDDNYSGTSALHLQNNNIHFDSIDGDFIIEPFGIYSFSNSNNKGFRLNKDELTFNEYYGAEFKPVEINRNFGIQMQNATGFKTVDISNQNGDIWLYGQNGIGKATINESFNSGYVATYNYIGSPICQFWSTGTNHDHGYVSVCNQNGSIKAGMYVDDNDKGHIFADVKNFVTPDPDNDKDLIMYASLEGPEAAAYDRGKSKLTSGKAFIPFKSHFKKIINTETVTIQLTPISATSKGLAITKITKDGFWVKELNNGMGVYDFFWEAKGVRKGFEDYEVIVPKSTLELQKTLK